MFDNTKEKRKMHIQQAELLLSGYGEKDWHLIAPSDQKYLEAAQVFAAHQASVGRPIESIEIGVETGSTGLHQSWCNAVSGVAAQQIWAAKEILKSRAS